MRKPMGSRLEVAMSLVEISMSFSAPSFGVEALWYRISNYTLDMYNVAAFKSSKPISSQAAHLYSHLFSVPQVGHTGGRIRVR
jgi:hypothetical protein